MGKDIRNEEIKLADILGAGLMEDEGDKHKERHILLHRMLDELFADYIGHHPEQKGFLDMPLKTLLDWAHQQTIKPTEKHIKRAEVK